LCRLTNLSGRLPHGALHLLSSFLGGRGDAFRCLADLVYRLLRGVLQPLRDLPALATYLPNLFGRPFDHFPDLLGRSSSHFSDLLGRSSGHFSNLFGRSLGHLPNLLSRPFGYLSDLVGRAFSHFPNLLGHVTQSASQAAQTFLIFLAF
jgi:hypothetical protein